MRHRSSWVVVVAAAAAVAAACMCSATRVQHGPDGSVLINNVPYHRQITNYACGDASMEMVLHHYGPDVDQRALIDVMRTSSDYGTLSVDLVRGGHFSPMSKAPVTTMYPEQAPAAGLAGHAYGYAGFYRRSSSAASPCWVQELKQTLAAGYPTILLQWYDYNVTDGAHFRVAIGADANTVTLLDPWDRSNIGNDDDGSTNVATRARVIDTTNADDDDLPAGKKHPKHKAAPVPAADDDDLPAWTTQPRRITLHDGTLCKLWSYSEHNGNQQYGSYFAAVITPWQVGLRFDENAQGNVTITGTVTYPCPPGVCNTTDAWEAPTAAKVSGDLQLPSNWKVVASSGTQVPSLAPGQSVTMTWTVLVTDSMTKSGTMDTVTLTATGMVSSSVPATFWGGTTWIPGYSYTDLIGGSTTIIV